MPSTRSKGGNKARLPLPHICTSKQQAAGVGADCDLGTAVVLVPPESKERKKNQEQNFKDASGNVSDVDSECIILAKTTPENVKSRVAPPTGGFSLDSIILVWFNWSLKTHSTPSAGYSSFQISSEQVHTRAKFFSVYVWRPSPKTGCHCWGGSNFQGE